MTVPSTNIGVLTLPPDASSLGQTWYLQALILDVGITSIDLAISNGGVMTLGFF